MSNNAVAIVIPAYNASATIARAVISALREPEVAEIIVVDDGSTDDTIASAISVADKSKRLRIIALNNNHGPSTARNRAIAESAAPWIGILDADDYILPGRFKPLLALADEADFIADDLWQVPESAHGKFTTSLFGDAISKPQAVSFIDFIESNVTRPNRQRGELGFIKPIMRRRFLENHQLRYQENLRLGEDYELYARALACGARMFLVPERGYVSVMRPNSLSGTHSIEDLRKLRDCDDSLASLPELTEEDRKALRQHYLSVDCRLQWRLLIEAVKQRDLRGCLTSFRRPHPIPSYLLSKLSRELAQRTGKLFGRAIHA
jgi:succinoglycan biosynthesis protein ExoU